MCKWSTAEDLVLISAWLNTSKDPVVGNEQNARTFWKRIVSYNNASPKRTSGQSEDDVLKAAHEIFLNDYKVKFSLEHAWRELRNDQKWCGTYGSSQQSSGSKRKRVGEEQSFQSSTSMPSVNGEDEATARPIGVKASKAKAKRGTSHTQPEIEPRKRIVCGLSAREIIPPLPQEDTDDDVVDIPQEDTVEVVEISDEEEEDMVELSSEEYRTNMGYLIRVEESEGDIEPEFRRML
ncbi:PREDICTED: glutathione S-transferase T2-like [Brassica oleracea var. oleracea]|uniref:glutathione S-transferase T2-like n=1 Tax=Brassica oleracea var. oleracea TaxID=109376 RepID=UPI0006A6DC23|nr:PREDICTED: glutathione S-transferase T2-like [Brassica oleracea var. oleracea]